MNTVNDDGLDRTAHVNETTRISDNADSNCARLRSPISVIEGWASVRKRQILVIAFAGVA